MKDTLPDAPAKPRNAGTGGTASRAAFLACQKPVDRVRVPVCMIGKD